MQKLVHFALFASLATALSPWNSSDQEKKLGVDKDALAKISKTVGYLQDLDDDVTSRLKANTSEQELLKNLVQQGSAQVASAKKDVNDTAGAQGAAQKAADAAKGAMDGASKTLSADQGATKEAQGKMAAAAKKSADATQALSNAKAAQDKAQKAVDEALPSGGAQLASALETLEDAKKASADAEKAEQEAMKEKDAALKALQDAQNKEKSASDDLASKTQTSKNADGSLAAAKQESDDAQKKLDAIQAYAGKQQYALDVQSEVVKSLQGEKATKDKNLAEAKQTQAELPGIIKKDEGCISSMQEQEIKLAGELNNWKATLNAYKSLDTSAPAEVLLNFKDNLWAIRVAIEELTSKLTETQKDCALYTVKIPDRPAPDACNTDTGGHCAFFWCHARRKAACVAEKCVCESMMCSDADGNCQPRDDPLSGGWSSGPPAILRSPPLLAEKASLPLDPPVEQENGQVVLVGGAMVAMVAMAALAFAKLQRREIRPPELLLG